LFSVNAFPHAAALVAFVASLRYQEGEIPAVFERMLTTGQTDLLVNLREDEFRTYSGADCAAVHRTHGAVLAGPRSRSTVIDTNEQRCLVRVDFKLGGAAGFFRLPVSETSNQFVELDQLWGRDGAVLRERLLEARTPKAKLQVLETILLEHLARLQRRDPAISFAPRPPEHRLFVSPAPSRPPPLPPTLWRPFCPPPGLPPTASSPFPPPPP